MSSIENEQKAIAKNTIEVYFLAAPQDEAVCHAIKMHLTPVIRNSTKAIEVLSDFDIPPGSDINKFKQKLLEAEIVLAFISVDYLNDNDCYRRTQKVIERFNKKETILLPILVRNCLWKSTPFVDLQLLPKNEQPINNKQYWNSEDDALTVVAAEIYNAINSYDANATAKYNVSDSERLDTDLFDEIQKNWRRAYYRKALWKRSMAFLLDTLLTIPIFGVIAWITTRIGVALNDRTWLVGELGTVPDSILYYGTPVLVFAIVLALLEASKWQGTLGKILMKIQVTDIAGNRISFARALKRNVFRVFFGNLWIILLVFFFHEMFKKFEYDLRELVDDPMIYFLLWVPLLIIQIVYYLISGKLIHDRFSGTVVGERL